MLYFLEMEFSRQDSYLTIRTSENIGDDFSIDMLNFCGFIFSRLYNKVFFSREIDKNNFDENILDDIAYHADLEVYASNIEDMIDVKIISFEYGEYLIQIKIYPPNKITIEADGITT